MIDDWAAYDLPRHLYHFDNNTLEKLLLKKGYKIIRKKRTYFDSMYISLLTKIQSNRPGYVKLLYIMIISIIKVTIKGADSSSSLYYVTQKN